MGTLGNKGQVSLTGALVASAIASGALMAVMSLLKFSSTQQRTIQNRADQTDFHATMRMIVDNPLLCQKAFWDNESSHGTPNPQIAYFDPDSSLPAEKLPYSIHFGDSVLTTLGDNIDVGTTVSLITLTEIAKTARQVGTTATTYLASLAIGFNTPQKTAYAKDGTVLLAPKPDLNIPLYVTTNESHQITGCSTAMPRPTPLPNVDWAHPDVTLWTGGGGSGWSTSVKKSASTFAYCAVFVTAESGAYEGCAAYAPGVGYELSGDPNNWLLYFSGGNYASGCGFYCFKWK